MSSQSCRKIMIRETRRTDQNAFLAILRESGQFDDAAITYIAQILEDHLNEGSDSIWLTADDGDPIGFAYCAPEPMTSGTWNLLMLWIKPGKRTQGHGSGLVAQVEEILANQNSRLLIVETSGLPEFEAARMFYSKVGFTQAARIKDFFSAGDDKLIYTKPIINS